MTPSLAGPLRAVPIHGIEIEVVDGARERWVTRATRAHDAAGTGHFAEPAAYVSFVCDADTTAVGYAYTQFALPVFGSARRPFDFDPAPNLSSPAAVIPLLLGAPGRGVTLLAPLDSWHEQIIAVRQSSAGIIEFRWGWHGDLAEIPAGFESSLGVYTGTSVAEVFRAWGGDLLASNKTTRPDRSTNPFTSHLSYWTDNGAAYWYRTEAGMDIGATLAAKKSELESLAVPIVGVELDSWFYPHELSRPVSEVGYLDEVPPTGMLSWTARPGVLPDGVEGLAASLDNPPLALHARHISAASPYLDEGEWWVDVGAHPVDETFFLRWFHDAASWGGVAIEQDWMLRSWFGVRQLRSAPGRALRWQRGLDDSAAAHGIGLIWCMATPGDMIATVELDNIIALRTCDDYRFAADPALLWHWYLTVNRLVDALDLVAFKDCFFSNADPGESGLDGDHHAEVEALLSAMSAGIAGIGDRLGCTDPAIVSRVCRDDGRLVQPDRPIVISDQSFFVDPHSADHLVWAETATGPWRYVLALHTAPSEEPITDSFDLGDEWLVYDWRAQSERVESRIECTIGFRDWAFYVICPIETDAEGVRHATIGDVRRYATMGHVRLDGAPPDSLYRWSEAPG